MKKKWIVTLVVTLVLMFGFVVPTVAGPIGGGYYPPRPTSITICFQCIGDCECDHALES